MTRYSVRKETVDGFGKESFPVGEDEMILTAEPRRGNAVVVFVAYPVEIDACGVCGCEVPCEHGCCGP